MSGLQPGAATMTVLFTDLVDSTAMRSRLGDDQADEVRREHDDLIARIVADNQGSVVKSLGDGVMAVFGAPSSGLATAVAVQQKVARRNRQAAVPISLRMGLSVGEVRVEADDVFGTPVVEASRLCTAAGSDQILAAEHVKILAGSRSPATYRPHGELTLKGLDEPLGTLEVLWWETSDAPTVPFPEIPTLHEPTPFVGRSIERYALGHAWLQARTAKAPLVLLSGPAGIGKTRLAVEYARTAMGEGGVVLFGRCSAGAGPAFQPFAEAVRAYAGNVPSGQLADLLGPFAGELTHIVPELRDRLGDADANRSVDPELATLRLYDAVTGWLAAASRDEPVILVLDDLHWASTSTLDLLHHVMTASSPMRVLVVVTARDDADGAHVPVLDRLRRTARGVEAIDVGGLGDADIASIASALTGGDSGAADAVAGAAGGNPLLAAELARLVVGAPASVIDLPTTLAPVIERRLAALEDDDRAVARAAAVAGTEFDVAAVQAVIERDDASFQASLDRLGSAALIAQLNDSRPRYAFVHAAIADAVAREVAPSDREAWHRRFAEVLARVDATDDRSVVERAWQYTLAGPPGDEGGIAAVRAAADRARDQLAHGEAAAWYGRALALAGPDAPGSLDLRIERAVAAGRADDPEARAAWLDAVNAACDAEDAAGIARAASAWAPAFLGQARPADPERVAALRRALGTVADGPERAWLLAELGLASVWASDGDDRVERADEAAALADGGDPALRAFVLARRLVTIDAPGSLDERRRGAAELFELADAIDDPVGRFHAAAARAATAGEAGDWADHDEWLGIAATVASGLDVARLTAVVALARAARALVAGELDTADRYALDARSAAQEADEPTLAAGAERIGSTVAAVRGGVVDASGSDGEHDAFLGAWLATLGATAGPDTGDVEMGEPGLADEGRPTTGAVWVRSAEIAARRGDAATASRLIEQLEPFADRWFRADVVGPVAAHSLAVAAAAAGRPDDADRWFAEALAAHDAADAPLLAAETRLAWAAACLEAGDIDRARDLVGQALPAAAKVGAAGVEARARALLTATFDTGAAEPAEVEAEATGSDHGGDEVGADAFAVPPLPAVPPPPAPVPSLEEPPVEPVSVGATPTDEIAVPPLPPVPPAPGPIPPS